MQTPGFFSTHTLSRRVSAAFGLLLFVGCSGSAPDISPKLKIGDSAVGRMRTAAAARAYDEYFQHYELLRQAYIDVADTISRHSSLLDSTKTVNKLREWESWVASARSAWKGLGETKLDQELESLLTPEPRTAIAEMDEKSKQHRAKIEAEWAPLELELDESIASVHALLGN